MHSFRPFARRASAFLRASSAAIAAVLLPFAATAVLLLAGVAVAADAVTVTLASGRSFTGMVDVQSDDRQLVLRTRLDGITLWRPIDWQRIVRVESGGLSLTAEDLRAELEIPGASLLNGDQDDQFSDSEEIIALPSQPDPNAAPVREQLDLNQATAIPPGPEVSRVAALQLDAVGVGRWRAGVEQDGLLLRVIPLDEFGRAVPVDGTLSVTLIGTRPSAFRGEFVQSRGEPFPQLGHWRVQLTPADFRYGEAQVRLPFQAQHPQFNLELGAMAVVNADLVVPGAGVLSASADFVRIRPYSPTRDWLQQLDGYRYFPGERTLRRQ